MASLPTQASSDLAGVYLLDILPKIKTYDALNQQLYILYFLQLNKSNSILYMCTPNVFRFMENVLLLRLLRVYLSVVIQHIRKIREIIFAFLILLRGYQNEHIVRIGIA